MSTRHEFEPDATFFEGHFEGRPILPAMAQLEYVRRALAEAAPDRAVVAVLAARMRAPLLPGERLTVSLGALGEQGAARVRFQVLRADEVVTQGVLRVE